MAKQKNKSKKLSFADKALDNFKILLTTEGLLIDIQSIRDKWDIKIPIETPILEIIEPPPALFDEATNPAFKNIKDLVKFLIKKQKEETIAEREKRLERNRRMNEDRDYIMKKYDIPLIYLELLGGFISQGKLNVWLFRQNNPTGAHFVSYINGDDERVMAIRIYPETNLDDIRDEWDEIHAMREKILKEKNNKHTSYKNINKDLRAYQLSILGLKSSDIASIINMEHGGTWAYTDVNKALSKLKDKKDIEVLEALDPYWLR